MDSEVMTWLAIALAGALWFLVAIKVFFTCYRRLNKIEEEEKQKAPPG